MTDEERINAEIDAWPWQHLLMLADLAEERGETEIADGYRWLAKGKRLPRLRWRNTDEYFWWWDDDGEKRQPSYIPVVESGSWKHKDKSVAFRAAAVAVGRWLREEREKMPKK